MTVEQGFRTSEVMKLTGVTKRQLDYWNRTGFLKPSLASGEGRGRARFYSYRDVVRLKVAKELRDSGVPLQVLRKVVKCLRGVEGLENPLAEAHIVVGGSDVLLVHGREELVSVLRAPGQGVLHIVFNLPMIVQELQESIRKLKGTA